MLIVCAQVTFRKTYINIVNTLCNNVNSDLTFHYKYSKMVMQINDIESDLDDISILQTEDGNTSDITINYSSDPSSIGTIIYYHNLHNDCDQVNTPWGKPVNVRYIIMILFELYLVINIIIIIKLFSI